MNFMIIDSFHLCKHYQGANKAEASGSSSHKHLLSIGNELIITVADWRLAFVLK